MQFELIVVQSSDGIIGANNKIPWYLPEDLQYFKKTTERGIVVMGRKTFESLPNGPLKNRYNIVLTNGESKEYDNVCFTNIENMWSVLHDHIKEKGNNSTVEHGEYPKIFVIGGSEIYKLLMPYCNKIHMTIIYDQIFEGDTYFPFTMEELQEKYRISLETEILHSKTGTKYKHMVLEVIS
jgi:dihydrofolate reductase